MTVILWWIAIVLAVLVIPVWIAMLCFVYVGIIGIVTDWYDNFSARRSMEKNENERLERVRLAEGVEKTPSRAFVDGVEISHFLANLDGTVRAVPAEGVKKPKTKLKDVIGFG
jgi:hypothetical protein